MDLESAARSLPIFPLPRVVLMPGAMLPLHVFEPRYRALVDHVRQGEGLMGIATLRPGYEAHYDGSPPIHPEIGVGRLTAYQPMQDGRSNIVLTFVDRVIVEEEIDSPHPFRLIRGRVSPCVPLGSSGFAGVRGLMGSLATAAPRIADEVQRLLELDDASMVDALARRLLDGPDVRRAYLGAERSAERVRLVESELATLLAAAGPAVAEA